MRVIGFIIALLLLDGAVEPTQGWLIALVVVTGLAVFRPRPWSPLHLRPAIDERLVAFVLVPIAAIVAVATASAVAALLPVARRTGTK